MASRKYQGLLLLVLTPRPLLRARRNDERAPPKGTSTSLQRRTARRMRPRKRRKRRRRRSRGNYSHLISLLLCLHCCCTRLWISSRLVNNCERPFSILSAFAGDSAHRTAGAAPYFCARSRRTSTDLPSSLHASRGLALNKVSIVSRLSLHMMFCSNLSTLSEPSLRRWLWRYLNDPDPLILISSARHHTDPSLDSPSPPTSSPYIVPCICLCSNEFLLLCRKDPGPP